MKERGGTRKTIYEIGKGTITAVLVTLASVLLFALILDLSGVTFTDSAGLGLILGRYTRISGYGGKMKLTGVSDEFMKILRLAGTDRFIETEKRKRTQTAV